jgi:hypothetical protein
MGHNNISMKYAILSDLDSITYYHPGVQSDTIPDSDPVADTDKRADGNLFRDGAVLTNNSAFMDTGSNKGSGQQIIMDNRRGKVRIIGNNLRHQNIFHPLRNNATIGPATGKFIRMFHIHKKGQLTRSCQIKTVQPGYSDRTITDNLARDKPGQFL